jgi:hypothetical protein
MVIAVPPVAVLIASAAERIQIHPRYKPGETLYYQIESHTASTGKTTTPIINPEGGTKFSRSVDLLVRLDVLSEIDAAGRAKSQQIGEPAKIDMRVTYERAHAESQTDAPEFDAPAAGTEADQLVGHSFEFTLEPGGSVSNFRDPDNILPKLGDGATALSWTKTLASSSGFPSRGISIGGKWTSDRPLETAPLAGLVWHTESIYLRNEPCRISLVSSGRRNRGASAAQVCAVILTQFRILRRGSSHADQTPPDYVRHGLRTAGTLTGSGESLDSFSLETGLLVNSTQNSTQRADFDIINAANGEKIHRAAQVQTQTVITRVAMPPATKP